MSLPRIHGVLPPMVTPFQKNGDLDLDGFVRNIERWNRDDLAGVLVLGSNSEAAFLSEEEKLQLINLTAKHAERGRVILAGTGVESEKETIRLTNRAAALGAHGALVLTPHYYLDQMTDSTLIRFFVHVADQSDIPILIYNVPKFTHVNTSVDAVRELSRHPKIAGMKDSTGDVPRLAALKAAVPAEFQVIVGTASAWYAALELGITAGILALANCTPNQCSLVQRRFDAGDRSRGEILSKVLLPVNTAVTSKYGIAGLKHACTLMGYVGGEVRAPLLSLTEDQKVEIGTALRSAGILQAPPSSAFDP